MPARVWWDGELFSGKPDWNKLLAYRKPALTPEEQAFVDGTVEELCRMCDDWQITYELNDLPPHIWQFIKDKGFLGMIIPKQYGGLGFSALAHSQVVMKLATRSATACVSVMVPNSLGPAELLLHYGTDEQKNHLPAAPRAGIGNAVLRADGAGSGVGCGRDSGFRRRVPRHPRRQRSARHAAHVGEALHHARARRHLAGPRVQVVRPGPSAREIAKTSALLWP